MRSVPPTAWLLLILFCGLCLRLALFSTEGYGYDVHLYKQWSQSAALYGPSDSYEKQIDGNMTPDYPPFSILLFWGIGKTAAALPSCTIDSLCLHLLVKLPGILADLLTATIFYFFLLSYVGTRRALFAAAIFTFHPVVFYNSAIWGQTDSLYTMLIVSTLMLFSEKQWFLAGAYAALAITTKLQAIIMFPLLPFLLPLERKAWINCATGSLVMLGIVLLPYISTPGGIDHVANMYLHSIGKYPVISANAYNFWWSLLADRASGTSSSNPLFGFFTYRMMGVSLVLLFYGMIIALLQKGILAERPKRDRTGMIFLAAGTLALAFFLFNTEMHERYSFPFIALFLPVIFLRRGYTGLYITASGIIFMNILGVLPALKVDRWLFATFPSLDVFFASTLVCVFFLLMRKIVMQSMLLARLPASSWNIRPLLHSKKKTPRKRTR